MKKTTLMLLASAALALPGALPAMAQNTPANQPARAQSPDQPQAQNQRTQGQDQQAEGQNQQASNQISASQLGRRGVRQVQLALNKSGHHVGRPDGIMGRRTREALQSYQKSKGMQANGKINQQTLADLGVQVGQGNQPSNQQNNNQPNQNQNNPGGNASPGTNR